MSRFLEALHSGRVLLMDGAMGTELQRAGIQDGECYELWNLTHPEKVRAIHQAYVDAGAEVLLTSTFQANPENLARFGLEGHLEEITRAAVQLARDVAGPNRFVLGCIGPRADKQTRIKPFWSIASFHGVDGLLLETCTDELDLVAIQKAQEETFHPPCREKSLPVLVSWSYLNQEDGLARTNDNWHPESCTRKTSRFAAAALGVNCGRDIGMGEVIEIVRRYRTVTDLPLFARPNAGTPTRVGGRWVYPHTPEQMAARLPELLEAGVNMVGGCCGTTPAHIAAFRRVVDEWNRLTFRET